MPATKDAKVPAQSSIHFESLGERIARIAEDKGEPFRIEQYERMLFIDEATLSYSKTELWPYEDFDERLKGMGIGIGMLRTFEKHDSSGNHRPGYRMRLMHHDAIVSYNKGKTDHWQLLSGMMVDPINEACREAYRGHGRVEAYVCTQSNMFLQDYAEMFDRKLGFIEINGTPGIKKNHRYEYLFKEEVGRLVKRKLWLDKNPLVVSALYNEKMGGIISGSKVWNIKEELLKNTAFIRQVRKELWEKESGTDPTQTKIKRRGQ